MNRDLDILMLLLLNDLLRTAVSICRPPALAGGADASLSSSGMSARDVFRQLYSVTWHPRLSYFIVSDGYMATVLRLMDNPSPALLIKTLLHDATKELQKAADKLNKSQVIHLLYHLASLYLFISCRRFIEKLLFLSDGCGDLAGLGVFPKSTQPSGL